jgi:cytohesin
MDHDLHWYAESGQIDRLRADLEAGADREARDEDGRTPLQIATEKGRLDVIEVLADAGADLDAAEGVAPSLRPLHRACLVSERFALVRNEEMARLLLRRGADPAVPDDAGRTPLHLAIEWCGSDLLERFIDKGADPVATDESGRTPLHVACARGAMSMADHLIEGEGAAAARRKDTALARLEDESVLETLIADGANPAEPDGQGITPIHVAAERGTEWAAKILLAHGADPNSVDSYRATPLHRAADANVAELLIAHGADLNPLDKDGNPPLHRAVGSGRIDVADVLLERGADVRVANADGRTALHVAASSGRAHTVEKLVARGADVNAPDRDGRTPLTVAKEGGHTLVVQTLKRHGGRTRKRRSFFGF